MEKQTRNWLPRGIGVRCGRSANQVLQLATLDRRRDVAARQAASNVVSLAHGGGHTGAPLNRRSWFDRTRSHAALWAPRFGVHRDAGARANVKWQQAHSDRPANRQMEPTRLTVCAIMSPRRAAHLQR